MYCKGDCYRVVNSSRRPSMFHGFGEANQRFQEQLSDIQEVTRPLSSLQREYTYSSRPDVPLTKYKKKRLQKARRSAKGIFQRAMSNVTQGAADPKCQMTSSEKNVTDSATGKRESPMVKTRRQKQKSMGKHLSSSHVLHKDRSMKYKNAARRNTSKNVKKPKSKNPEQRKLNTCSNGIENSEACCALIATFPEHDEGWKDVSDASTEQSLSPASISSSGNGQYMLEHITSRPAPVPTKQKQPMSDSDDSYNNDKKISTVATASKSNVARVIVETPKSRHSWSNGSNEEEIHRPSERKKRVRRSLFKVSGVHSASKQMSFSTKPSDNDIDPNKSPPRILIPGVHTCKSLEQDWRPLPLDYLEEYFLSHSEPLSNRESRVLSHLANRQDRESSHTISKEAEDNRIWRNTELNENQFAQGLNRLKDVSTPKKSDAGEKDVSTPVDQWDRQIIYCKGQWNIYTDIPPPPSSPIVQPTELLPMDTSFAGYLLSGLLSSLRKPLATPNVYSLTKEYPLNLGQVGTPGNMIKAYDSKEEFDNLVPYANIPSYPARQPVANETSTQEQEVVTKMKEIFEQKMQELIQNRNERINFEVRQIMKEEQSKLLENMEKDALSMQNRTLKEMLEQWHEIPKKDSNLPVFNEVRQKNCEEIKEKEQCDLRPTSLATQDLKTISDFSDNGLTSPGKKDEATEGVCSAVEKWNLTDKWQLIFSDNAADRQEPEKED